MILFFSLIGVAKSCFFFPKNQLLLLLSFDFLFLIPCNCAPIFIISILLLTLGLVYSSFPGSLRYKITLFDIILFASVSIDCYNFFIELFLLHLVSFGKLLFLFLFVSRYFFYFLFGFFFDPLIVNVCCLIFMFSEFSYSLYGTDF